ncbi:MAG: RtcB family protein [Dorea sp.]|jgi:RNA-splicing ligase RtcB|nr:RtcB family protein [Dorea sp.]
MKTVSGVYTSAKIFTDQIEAYALAQIRLLCDNAAFEGCKIRIMPDVHPGKVGTIGFTSSVGDKILPNVVGIDIGCGVTLARLKQKKTEFQKLDKVIQRCVPAGFQIRQEPHRFIEDFDYLALNCIEHVKLTKLEQSLGTLGGGNHFIELDQDEEGYLWVAIHSGSRRLGKEVTEYYLTKGQKEIKAKAKSVPYELTYLEGSLMEEYLHDVQVVQEYAKLNRKAILDEMVKGMKWKVQEQISSVHNYIDASGDEMLLRKGAVSAKEGETVVIPVNGRDGILLGVGKGNADWNYSAPHGAGRKLKREEVAKRFTVPQFRAEMKGIYSTCIGKETLDEAPFAYRELGELEGWIGDTVDIGRRLRPVYNYKAGREKW